MIIEKEIKVIIADDEPLAREAIKVYLRNSGSFRILKECKDGMSALRSIQEHKPDLVLLDIEMPELKGIELVRLLKPPYPHIVFITAFESYAIRAFEENAIDYILKPFNKERFDKMIDRVRYVTSQNNPGLLNELNKAVQRIQKPERKKYLKRISSKRNGRIYFIPIEEIIWIESAGSFSKLHMEKNIELANFSIKQLEELLDPSQHIRIHKSHMVNLDRIQSIESYFHGEYILTMSCGTTLKLSRGYKNRIDQIVNQYK